MLDHLKKWWATHLTWATVVVSFLTPSVNDWVAHHPAQAVVIGGIWSVILHQLTPPLAKVNSAAKMLIACLLAGTITIQGCNASAVQAYVNLAVGIAVQIAVLAGAPISASNKISADLAIANKLAGDLRSADASAKPGVLNKLDAELTAAEQDLGDILTLASVKDPAIIKDVRAGLGIAVTAVESLRDLENSQVSGGSAVKGVTRTTMKIALPGGIAPGNSRLSADDLKKAYNTALAAHPEAQLK